MLSMTGVTLPASMSSHRSSRSDARCLDSSGRRFWLAPVLAGLDAGQRDVLLLTAWADLTLDAVAEVLDDGPGQR